MMKANRIELSERQQFCLDFIRDFQKQNKGRTPAMAKVAEAMECSKQRVMQHILRLEELGCLTRTVEFQRQEITITGK